MLRNRFILSVMSILMAWGGLFAQGIQVDPQTGKGSMYIPIYNLKAGSIGAPVGVGYTTEGVKVQEGAGVLGYTWGLDAGGGVYRSVRGIPDDFIFSLGFKGWMHATTAAEIGTYNFNQSETTVYNYINGLNFSKDTEPDLFTVRAPGLSMSFVFGNDGLIKPLYQTDCKVSYTLNTNGSISGFEVINENGVKYSFMDRECLQTKLSVNTFDYLAYDSEMMGPSAKGISFAVAWKLTQITDPGSNSIHFDYERLLLDAEALKLSEMSMSNSLEVSIKLGNKDTLLTAQEQSTIYSQLILSRIYTLNASVDFIINYETLEIENPIEEGNDYLDSIFADYEQLNKKPLIKRINVYEGESSVRKLVRFYDFHYHKFTLPEIIGSNEDQFFLRAVQEGGIGTENPPFLFDYYGVDYVAGTTLLEPRSSYHSDFWGYPSSHSNGFIPKVYVYQNPVFPSEFYSVFPKAAVTATLTIDGSNRNVDTLAVKYGSLSKIHFPSGGFQTIQYEPNTFYDARYYNAANLSTYSGAGIRVKKLTLNDGVSAANNIVKQYEYLNANGQPSGEISYLPMHAFAVPYYKNPKTGAVTNYDQIGNNLDKIKYLTVRTSESIAGKNDPYVLYKRVKETITNNGSIVYEFNNALDIPAMYGDSLAGTEWTATHQKIARPSVSTNYKLGFVRAGNYTYPYSPQTNYSFERSKLTRMAMYNEAGALVKEDKYTYSRLYNVGSSQPTIVKALHYDLLPTYYGATTNKMFKYGVYTWLTGLKNVSATKEEIVYSPEAPAKSLKSTVTYHYEGANHRRMTAMSTVGSDNTQYRTMIKYPQDFALTGNPSGAHNIAIKSMKDKNILNVPIEQTTYIPDGGTTNLQNVLRSSYVDFDNLGRPLSFFSLKNTSAFAPAHVSGNSVLKDNDYYKVSSIVSYNAQGSPLSTFDNAALHRSGVHYGHGGLVQTLGISGAYAENVVYNNFDSPAGGTNSFTLAGNWPNHPFTSGRRDETALLYTVQAGKSLLDTLTNTGYFKSRYIISFHYKSTVSATMTVKLKELGTGTVKHTETIALPISSNWGRISRNVFPSLALPENCQVEITTTGATITLDDLLLAPESALVSITNYDEHLNPVASMDVNGQEQLVEYDGMGRAKIVRDVDNNIRTRNNYQNRDYEKLYSAYFSYESCDGNDIVYTAIDYDDPTISYSWSFDDVPVVHPGGFGPHEFYRDEISETVTLEVYKSGVLKDRVTQRINFSFPFSICVDGPTHTDPDDLLDPVKEFSTCQRSDAENEVAGPTLFTLVTNKIPCSICQWENASYQWRYKTEKGKIWTNIGTNSPSVSIDLDFNYNVSCIVTSVCGSSVTIISPQTITFEGLL